MEKSNYAPEAAPIVTALPASQALSTILVQKLVLPAPLAALNVILLC
jgi:hypothetical protein